MYPAILPDEDKVLWTHNDIFNDKEKVLVKGFVHSNYSINMHEHDFYELNLVLKGNGIHYVNNNSFSIKAGDMFVIPPGFKHGYYMLETLNVYHLLIHTKFFAKYKDELEFLPGYLMLFTIEPVFRKEINFRYFLRLDKNAEDQLLYYSQRIKEESEKDSLETPLMLHTLVLHIIVMLSRLYREQYSIIENKKALHSSFSSIVSSIEYIQENFTKKIAIEDLLKIAYMSRSTYLRLFYKTTGHTPGDYINQYRISKARQMLLENDSTITNIALNTGFCDSSHFSHLFNKYTNMSPTEYRLYFQRF